MKREYKAIASFVPPEFSSIQSIDYSANDHSRIEMGSIEDVDRCVEILNSGAAIDYVGKEYNLPYHYEIVDEKQNNVHLSDYPHIFQDKIETKFTENTTVSITVYDEDPKMAANIANSLLTYVDSIIEKLSNRTIGLQKSKEKYLSLEKDILLTRDSLANIRQKYHIYNLIRVDASVLNKLTDNFSNKEAYHKHYDKLTVLNRKLDYLLERYGFAKAEYYKRKEHLETYPHLMLKISEAHEPGVHFRPKRRTIFAITVVVAFIFASILAVFAENFKKQK